MLVRTWEKYILFLYLYLSLLSMISLAFTYIFLGISLFIPIVIWSYIFSFIDGSAISKRRLVFGIMAWGFSVLPILYMDPFLTWLGYSDWSVFSRIFHLSSLWSFLGFSITLMLLILWLAVVPSLLRTLSHYRDSRIFWVIGTMGVFVVGFFLLQVFFSLFPGLNVFISESIYFSGYIFNSLKLIVFYYLMVGFIEEIAKNLYVSWDTHSNTKKQKQRIMSAIFVALGFSFIENILYAIVFFHSFGFGSELVVLSVGRSIFSTMLHVLCSVVAVSGYYYIKDISHKSVLSVATIPLLVAIVLHALYDVSLSVGLSFMIFVYLIGGYLYIGALLYEDTPVRD